jgi:hypothetical protein
MSNRNKKSVKTLEICYVKKEQEKEEETYSEYDELNLYTWAMLCQSNLK